MEINRLVCKYYGHNTAEIIWHFSSLPLGQAEYSFVSSNEWWCKRARFLSPNRISELVWDSESEDTSASESTSEEEGCSQDEPGVSHLQPDRPTSSGQASSSSFVMVLRVGQVNSGHGPLALREV